MNENIRITTKKSIRNNSFRKEDIEEANFRLRYGIKLLHKNVGCQQPFNGAISGVLTLIEYLKRDGFWWQSKQLTGWLRKAQKRGDFFER